MAKTYLEYLANSKPITRDPAPVGASPKNVNGDSHKYNVKVKNMKGLK